MLTITLLLELMYFHYTRAVYAVQKTLFLSPDSLYLTIAARAACCWATCRRTMLPRLSYYRQQKLKGKTLS